MALNADGRQKQYEDVKFVGKQLTSHSEAALKSDQTLPTRDSLHIWPQLQSMPAWKQKSACGTQDSLPSLAACDTQDSLPSISPFTRASSTAYDTLDSLPSFAASGTQDSLPTLSTYGTQDSLPNFTPAQRALGFSTWDSLPDHTSQASDSEPPDYSSQEEPPDCRSKGSERECSDESESEISNADAKDDQEESLAARRVKWLQRRARKKELAKAQARRGLSYAQLLKNQVSRLSATRLTLSQNLDPRPGIQFDSSEASPYDAVEVPRLVQPNERLFTIQSSSEASNSESASDVASSLVSEQRSPRSGVNTRDSLPSLPPIQDSEHSSSDSASDSEHGSSIKSQPEWPSSNEPQLETISSSGTLEATPGDTITNRHDTDANSDADGSDISTNIYDTDANNYADGGDTSTNRCDSDANNDVDGAGDETTLPTCDPLHIWSRLQSVPAWKQKSAWGTQDSLPSFAACDTQDSLPSMSPFTQASSTAYGTLDSLPSFAASGTQDSLPTLSTYGTQDSLPNFTPAQRTLGFSTWDSWADHTSQASDSEPPDYRSKGSETEATDESESDISNADTKDDQKESLADKRAKWLERRARKKDLAKARARGGLSYAQLLKNQVSQLSATRLTVSQDMDLRPASQFDSSKQCPYDAVAVRRLVQPNERLSTIQSSSEASNSEGASDVASSLASEPRSPRSAAGNTRDSLPSLPPIPDSEHSSSDSASDSEHSLSVKSQPDSTASKQLQPETTSSSASLELAHGGVDSEDALVEVLIERYASTIGVRNSQGF